MSAMLKKLKMKYNEFWLTISLIFVKLMGKNKKVNYIYSLPFPEKNYYDKVNKNSYSFNNKF
jgi:hypothetical protein